MKIITRRDNVKLFSLFAVLLFSSLSFSQEIIESNVLRCDINLTQTHTTFDLGTQHTYPTSLFHHSLFQEYLERDLARTPYKLLELGHKSVYLSHRITHFDSVDNQYMDLYVYEYSNPDVDGEFLVRTLIHEQRVYVNEVKNLEIAENISLQSSCIIIRSIFEAPF